MQLKTNRSNASLFHPGVGAQPCCLHWLPLRVSAHLGHLNTWKTFMLTLLAKHFSKNSFQISVISYASALPLRIPEYWTQPLYLAIAKWECLRSTAVWGSGKSIIRQNISHFSKLQINYIDGTWIPKESEYN